ncbi:MAG: 2-oxoacid:acceptor oxidoreductase subunit alpha [Rhodospirillaceae bacterium]|jgi:2-oxoglutarate/2-oxoacid ferredoxin oxidoreductase subunit alpha|nr:2-oxoacid:acceptor oxidoreductase subunit alpha [Rhodospirillaceae bacterium]MBT5192065.1 2-oxoacid:acceptor oxidoreductase subunit alpha [Rhodospirillaceae bacterium]MBT5899258.1 2-oxoacid:acceptor oxidoreductase subunit alpha [Rhodospirillaceae bacterium]MBT6426513.1 2-oxoacid:acceptor oxidoreductase subunit alpha [Rhodospirillaceae bacterium]MBT7756651.1 2-oxoacid:acceptor oxidoreductase subunit alpha [Rhodospirillaceae bacterium]
MTGSKAQTIAMIGSGGAGVMTAAEILLRVAARAGYFGLMTKSFGPQIRGGEAAAFVTLSTSPVEIQGDRIDLLFAIDWNNAERFAGELNIASDALVISGLPGTNPPAIVTDHRPALVEINLKSLTRTHKGTRPNMVALGTVAGALGLPKDVVMELVDERLASKGEATMSQGRTAIGLGYIEAEGLDSMPLAPSEGAAPRWIISGNQAAGYGAMRGGVRFAAAYPITPATEILEWLAPRLQKAGGLLVQAEDELASINMIIGGSFGGAAVLTATSGPGLALMSESIGLAVAAEIPLLVIDVMRGGPSTGIPTKSEQSDLNIAVYGLHGDAPHVVTAPNSIADCLFTAQWSTHLAESMQVPVIMLSDQSFGQALGVVERPAELAFATRRLVVEAPAENYQRYAVTASGVSPMAIPGTPGGQYTADGLEHNETGIPSSGVEDHNRQLEKRLTKVTNFDYGDHWAQIEGDGPAAIITWGSTTGPVRQAMRRIDPHGERLRLISLRLISPAQPECLARALAGCERIMVVEQSQMAQFFGHLKAQFDLPSHADLYARPGPQPFRADEIAAKLEDWLS